MKKISVTLLVTPLFLSLCISTIPLVSATESKLWGVIVCCTPDLSEESRFLYETLTTYYNFTDIYYLHVDTFIPEVDNEDTKDNIRWAFTNWLAERSTPNDLVFIYFMSHGGGWNMLNYWFYSPNTFAGGRVDLNGDEGNEVTESSVMPNPMDVNHDGDYNDWFGVDEVMFVDNCTDVYLDDELAYDLSGIDYSTLIFVYVGCLNPFNATEHCYSGGFIDDLSAQNRIIMTPSNETFPAVRKFEKLFYPNGTLNEIITYNMSFWGEQFISALGANSTDADINNDAKVSMKEAFDFAYANDPMTRDWHLNPPEVCVEITETPWLDDNGNGYPTYVNEHYELDIWDGTVAIQTYLGFEPIVPWDLNGDRWVNIKDIVTVAVAFGSKLGDLNWNPIADVMPPWGLINIKDIVLVAVHFGETFSSSSSSSSNSAMAGVLTEGTAVLSVNPNRITVYKHETFSVNVTITDVTNLYGWEFKLYWNSTLLNCTGAEIHTPSVWSENVFEAGTGIQNGFNITHGRYWKAMSALYPAPSFNGNMVVVTLTFEARVAGNSILDLQDIILVNGEAYDIPHTAVDCSVTVLPLLTVFAQDQYGNGLTSGDVYIDGQLVGYTGSSFAGWAGTHQVFVNDFWENGTTEYRYKFDHWEDGSIRNPRNITVVADTTITAYFVKKWCPGDVNGDGRVNIRDIGIVSMAFGSQRDLGDPWPPNGNWDSRADLNCDKIVNASDRDIVMANYGNVYE